MTEPHERVELDLTVPERSGTAFFIGRIASREVVEINVPFITAPDGAVGLAASQIKKLANQTEGDEIIWVRTGNDLTDVKPESEQEAEPTILAGGRVVIDHASKEVLVAGEDRKFTVTEYKIFEFLASRPGHVFPHEQIFDAAWGDHNYRSKASLSAHISSIRKKLGDDLTELLAVRHKFGYFVKTEFDGNVSK